MANSKKIKQTDFAALIWCAVIGAVCFVADIILCAVFPGTANIIISLILFAVYAAASILIAVFSYRISKNRAETEALISSKNDALRDLVAQVETAMYLTDGSGRLVWFNNIAAELFGFSDNSVGYDMYQICKTTEENLVEETRTGGISFSYKNRGYKLTCFMVHVQNESNDISDLYLTVFDDKTEITEAKRNLDNSTPVVAYIVMDNLDELTQHIKSNYRQATTEIDTILKEWANEIHGILREYDREHYVLIFKREYLKKLISDKFSILDKIRNVRLEDDVNSMPITVSMGIAATKSPEGLFDLTDFERDAMAALDIAFQRGGDQVVLKTENGLEYFGGITKAAQKRTKVRARVIASQLCTLISNASQVIVMGHKNPDFDAIGACIGVARLCMFCGVDCKVVSDFENDNFSIATEKLEFIDEYHSTFTDAATAIDTLTPDTLVVIVDVNNMAIVEAPEIVANAKSVFVIDHHRQVDELPESVITPPYIDPSASSTCELVAEVLEQCLPNGTLLKEEALIMLSGIMLDTNNFTRSTSTRTFGAALYLRGQGANTEMARAFFREEFSDYISEAKFGTDVSTYKHNIVITKSEGTGNPNDRIAAAKAADKLLAVKGVDASFALVKIGEGVNISGRSNGKINVQLILEKLNGGGHFDVAGARVEETAMEDAAEKLKAAIDEYFGERKR